MDLRTISIQNQDKTLKILNLFFSLFESVWFSDNTDLDKSVFNYKPQQTDS